MEIPLNIRGKTLASYNQLDWKGSVLKFFQSEKDIQTGSQLQELGITRLML